MAIRLWRTACKQPKKEKHLRRDPQAMDVPIGINRSLHSGPGWPIETITLRHNDGTSYDLVPGTDVKSTGRECLDRRIAINSALQIGDTVTGQYVERWKAFDIGVGTAAYVDPLLQDDLATMKAGDVVPLRITHLRPAEQCIIVQALPPQAIYNFVKKLSPPPTAD